MATTEVKTPPLPDGFQIEQDHPPLPDGFQLEQNKPSEQAPVTYSGLGKAVGSGALSGLVGLPGDVVSLINLGRRGIAAATGSKYDAKDDISLGQGYENVRNKVDQVYTPQNNAEEAAKFAGGFVPSIMTGPEGLAARGTAMGAAKVLAKRVATQAVAPYAAGKAAESAAEGTPLEGIAGPVAAMATGGVLAGRGKLPEPATAEEAGLAANKKFDAFREAPVTVRPDVVSDAAKNARNELSQRGLQDTPAGNAMASRIDDGTLTATQSLQPFNGRTPERLRDLQQLRTDLNDMAKRPDTPEGKAALVARSHVDQLLDNLTPAQTVTGGNRLAEAMQNLREGQALNRVKHQLNLVEGKEYRAEMNNAAAHTGDNINALRQQMKSLAINLSVFKWFGTI
jgi:hypothetical protein